MPRLFIAGILFFFVYSQSIRGQLFEETTKRPANKVLMTSTMVLSGSLGYIFGVGAGAITASAACRSCDRFGTSYNATFITTSYIGSSFFTTSMISGAAVVFNEAPRFWSTLLGSSVGAVSMPVVFYSISGDSSKRFAISFAVAWVTTVFSGMVGYYLGVFESNNENKVGFYPGWRPGEGSFMALKRF